MLQLAFFSGERTISWIFQNYNRRKELHFWHANDDVINPLLQKSYDFLCFIRKSLKERGSSGFSCVIRHFLRIGILGSLILLQCCDPWPFLRRRFDNELDFKIFLVDSLVHLAASINQEKKKRKYKFSR